jgi:hypothetical protein
MGDQWIVLFTGENNSGNSDKNGGVLVPWQTQPEQPQILWLQGENNQMHPVRDPATNYRTWLLSTTENEAKMNRWLAADPYNRSPATDGVVYPAW